MHATTTTAPGWNSSPPNSPRYATIQNEPKAELHIHAGGAFPPGFLLEIANNEELIELTQFITRLKQGMDYKDAFAVFPLISRIVNTNERLEEGAYRICESLKADGVKVAELRSGLKRLAGEDEEAYLKALLRGVARAKSESFSCSVILSIQRDSTKDFVHKTVELARKYMYRGVVGIDISGDSTKGNITEHIETLKKARDIGLFITAHIGESYEETDQMDILQELNPHRVGHGVCLCLPAIAWIKEHNTPVEVCPTSARLVTMHQPEEIHPWILEHRDNGHPIIVCTDDPTVFGVNVSDELYSLKNILSIDQITEIARSGLKHAFKAKVEADGIF